MKNSITLLVLMLISGCASVVGEGLQERIALERAGSEQAEIGIVTIAASGPSLTVRGTVTHRVWSRGSLEGHVRIEALDADGRVLSAVDAVYKNKSVRARSASFSGMLAVAPERVARVRVTDYGGRAGINAC